MAEPLLLDPEVEGLLREVAADPESTLLRLPRPSSVGSYFASQQESSLRVDLRRAETELLRVHREELAALVLQACEHRLLTWVDPPFQVVRFQDPRRLLEPLDRKTWNVALDRVVDSGTVTVTPILLAMRDSQTQRWPTVLELAELAHFIVPSDRARIFAGIALVYQGQPRTALRVLDDVVARRIEGRMAAYAWTNIGLARVAMDQRSHAATANRLGARLGERSGAAAMNWLYNSLLASSPDDVCEAAEWVDAHLEPGWPMLQEYVREQKARRRCDNLPQLEFARQKARKLSETWGASARSVASVFED
jgi:hypothetical protein